MAHVLRNLDLVLARVFRHACAHGMNPRSVLLLQLHLSLVDGLLQRLGIFEYPHNSELGS